MFTTYNDVYLDIRRRFIAEKISMPELEAYEIIRSVTGKSREEFLRDKYLHAPNSAANAARELSARRLRGEPLAYILGEWDFYGLTLYVDKNVLIPRDDTCALAEMAIRVSICLN